MPAGLGAAAAIVEAAILLAGIAAVATNRASSLRPWLLVLFGINAGRRGISMETLRGVPAVDVALLALAASSYGAFWPGPGSSHPAWMVLALGQPLVGIPLLMLTRQVGRSGLMGGGLVLALLMVVDGEWAGAGWLGVAATLLLLVGDFGTTGRPSRVLAGVVAVGYAALVAWFVWIAVLLLA